MPPPRNTWRIEQLPQAVQDLLAANDGLIRAGQGISRQHAQRLCSRGLLARIAQGAYVDPAVYHGLSDWEQFALASRAFVGSGLPGAYLAGWSAATVNGLPTMGRPPRLPLVVRPGKSLTGSTRCAYGRTRVEPIPENWLRHYDGVPATTVGHAACTIALSSRMPDALAVADHAVRQGGQLDDCIESFRGRAGIERARWVVAHASGLSESPLESFGRFAAYAGGLPVPVPNAWVGDTKPRFRLDGLWPYHWAGFEADGAMKYNDRPDAARIIADQQEREWFLRHALSIDLCRYTWRHARCNPDELASRFAGLLAANPIRAEPIRWWKHDPRRGPVEPSPEDWPSPHPQDHQLPARWWTDRR
ncbi:type IV toxin-antitoxin system AbiEi family antitoxin domain-containing protein [Lolliginicoccus suaedae]|uniref:type IV toxin-antitoxin system AbiEi family antitoxin domain-containing protein n=1 Tax=Lolliginicoccus suaedae TaxID=2605429 RepID=UPI0011EC7E13|nr:type IV toxin-antitoxin system AbiEi family antitoxin domain-containing protein [Lolliginicoccus suaedae]